MDIQHLFKQLGSIRAVARKTAYSRNTVRRMLRAKDPPSFDAPERPSAIDRFKPYLSERYTQHGLSAVRLLEEIRAQGFDGSLHMVRRFVQTLRPMRRAASAATLRFETAPGEQAQADWAYCGKHQGPSGRSIGIYLFVMVLGFSRMMYVRFTTSMRLAELIDCHRRGFDCFGGVPASVLYDNMKQVRLEGGKLNPAFVDFAAHFGFAVRTCRPRRARTKGKVERMVDYVKDNFLKGREFHGLDHLNAEAAHWLDNVANTRVHATTGHRPADLLDAERKVLAPLDAVRPYRFIERHVRRVLAESVVSYGRSRYSVPPRYVGREVEVTCLEGKVVIRSGDLIVAEHPAAARPGSSVTLKEHIDELWKLAAQRTPQPLPDWRLNFGQPVAVTPLQWYEQLFDIPAALSAQGVLS